MGDVIDYHHPMVRGVFGMKRVMGMPGDFVVKDGGEGKGTMMIQVWRLYMPRKPEINSAGTVDSEWLIEGFPIGA